MTHHRASRIATLTSLLVLAAPVWAAGQTMSQSVNSTLVDQPFDSTICSTGSSMSLWRSYTLANEGVATTIAVQSVAFGVHEATASFGGVQPMNIRLYRDPTPPAISPVAELALLHSETILIPDQMSSVHTQALSAPVHVCSNETLVVEIEGAPPGPFFADVFTFGGNGAGQTASTFYGCGFGEPAVAFVVPSVPFNGIIDVNYTPLGGGQAVAEPVEILDAAGDGAGNPLQRCWGITTDAAGNVYASGNLSRNAFRITPAGAVTEIIDFSGDGAGNTLMQPIGIATDAAGNVYVAGSGSDNAFRITPGGVITEIIDATGDGVHPLDGAESIATDAAGNVFVVGGVSDNAFRITPGGVITEIIDATGDGGAHPLDFAADVATDSAGNAYVTGFFTDNAFRITPGGVITEIIEAAGAGPGSTLDGARGVTTDAAGNAYVTGILSDNVFRITPGGVVTEIIDASGDGAGNTLDGPWRVATDAAGNVYVAARTSKNVFRITPSGVITEIIDASGDGTNPLDEAFDVAVDGAGDIVVAGGTGDNVFKIGLTRPQATSITRLDPDPTSAASVDFAVAFDTAVDGVSAGDFALDTMLGSAALGVPAAIDDFGSALDLAATSDRAIVTGFSGFPSTELTVELWVRETGPGSSGTPVNDQMTLVSYALPGCDNELRITDPASIGFALDTCGVGTLVDTDICVADGLWHHLAFVWESATGALVAYLDGREAFSTVYKPGLVLQSGGTLVLGEDQDSLGGGFNPSQAYTGQLDDLRIWNVARTRSQIRSTMGRTLTGSESGLALYWSLDALQDLGVGAGGANDLLDLSPNGNDGEVMGLPSLVASHPYRNVWRVPVTTGTALGFEETGTLGLDLVFNGSIRDAAGRALEEWQLAVDEIYSIVCSYAGTLEDFVLETEINGVGADACLRQVAPGDSLGVLIDSPSGTFDGFEIVLAAQVFTAGFPPIGALPSLHVNLINTPPAVIIYGQSPILSSALPPQGHSLIYAMPPAAAGTSIMLQALSVTSTAQNGFFAASNGTELRY